MGLEGPRWAVIAPNGPYELQKTPPESFLSQAPESPGLPRQSLYPSLLYILHRATAGGGYLLEHPGDDPSKSVARLGASWNASSSAGAGGARARAPARVLVGARRRAELEAWGRRAGRRAGCASSRRRRRADLANSGGLPKLLARGTAPPRTSPDPGAVTRPTECVAASRAGTRSLARAGHVDLTRPQICASPVCRPPPRPAHW